MNQPFNNEDLERFQDFEEEILNISEDIKYKEDIKMQGLIRKNFLDDTYGSENVNEIMEVFGFNTDLLVMNDVFNKVLSNFENRY